jgi:hypothetical protein
MICWSAIGMGVTFSTARAAEPAAVPAAVVLKYKGTVQYRLAAKDRWSTVQQTNLTLQVGAEISTKENSEVVLKLGSLSIVTVRELTLMRIKTIEAEHAAVDVDLGRVTANVKKTPQSSFTVGTPAAVAGVRGTLFNVETDEKKTSVIAVADGVVEVTGTVKDSRTVAVQKGEQVRVVFNAPPEDPRKAELRDLKEMEGFKELLSGGLGQAGAAFAEDAMKESQEAARVIDQSAKVKKGDAKVREDFKAIRAALIKCVLDTGYLPKVDDKPMDEKTSQLKLLLMDNKDDQGAPIPGWNGPYLEGNLKDPYGHFYKLRYRENSKHEGRLEVTSLGFDVLEKSDDPIPLMIRLDELLGPGGTPPAKPVRKTP